MKKIWSLSLIVIMVMALVGCSDIPAKDGGFGEPPGMREDNSQDYFNASVIEVSEDYLTVICTNPLQTVLLYI